VRGYVADLNVEFSVSNPSKIFLLCQKALKHHIYKYIIYVKKGKAIPVTGREGP
jgi:hypothetical protein